MVRQMRDHKSLWGLALIVPLALLTGCGDPPEEVLGAGLVPGEAFHAAARAAFADYQALSFARGAEVCGYFGFDDDGGFLASAPVIGDYDSCMVAYLPEAMVQIVASYHTHSSFDTEIDSEVPSTDDLRADISEQVFGYISTPGGRLWLVDWRSATAAQLCGLGCVLSDEDFIAGDAGVIAQSYTLDALEEREAGG